MGRILVVEDEPAIRDLLVTVLDDEGHVVVAAGNGQQALDRLADEPAGVDLVLTDLMMPVLDGLGLVAALRADARHAGLPVILMSAVPARMPPLEGAVTFLPKPFNLWRLLDLVAERLEERQQEKS